MKKAARHSYEPASENAMRQWLLHLLSTWTNETTDVKKMQHTFNRLLKGLGPDVQKKYALHRLIEVMKLVDTGLNELYTMIEKELL